MPAKPEPRIDVRKALAALRRDQQLAPLIAHHQRPVYRRTGTAFAALGRAILYQQLSGKAAGTILRRFTDRYPGHRFPTPAEVLALQTVDFVAAGVSRQKRRYLTDLARHFVAGTLNPRRFAWLSDEDLVNELTQVKGIGVWTVQMFQMSTLHRPDILPTGDLGIQKGMQKLFDLPDPPSAEQMEELSQPWQPWRSVACHYLWRHLDGDGA